MSDGPHESSNTGSALQAVAAEDGVQDAATDLAEGFVDVFLTSGALDEIPVVGSVLGFVRGVGALRDALFLRKLAAAVAGFGEATDSERAEWRTKLVGDPEMVEIGERLLYVIDASTSRLKAELVGRVFRRFIDGACDKSTLRRTVDMIGTALAEDLRELTNSGVNALTDSAYDRLASLGLVEGGPDVLTTDGGNVSVTFEGQLLR